MFERFTERARQVVVLAQDEARALKHNYIGTEHILLGLLREEEGLAARVLGSLDVSLDPVRAHVTRIIGQGDEVATGQIPFTPRAKKVLELALREARSLGHKYIGTEHVLLGLIREREGVAMRILLELGAAAETVRGRTLNALSGIEPRVARRVRAEATPYTPASPPFDPAFAAELERVRAEKEAAIEKQEFDRAATLRNREQTLALRGRELEASWRGEDAGVPQVVDAVTFPATPGRHDVREWPLAVAIVATAASFPIGLLVGWLIWG